MRASIGALAAVSFVALAGCDTIPEPITVYCEDFRVGAGAGAAGDLAGEVAYAPLAQAVSDVAVAASRLARDVDEACVDLALRFGAASTDPRLDPARPVGDHCDVASELLLARKQELVAAKLTVWVTEESCLADVGYQVACESGCRADRTCTEASIEARCPSGDALVACDGACDGACVGSESAPASCDGRCSGTCLGSCVDPEGDPLASFVPGERCTGRCVGKCGGTCESEKAERCDGTCRGSCEGTASTPRCASDLAAPSCPGDADCAAACRASAFARATCGSGALGVTSDAPSTAALARAIRALELDLPAVYLTSRGRGDALRQASKGLADSARRIVDADTISGQHAACAVLMAETGNVADGNARAALAAAKKVAAAVDAVTKRPSDE